jgi:hypothetical protein
LKNLERSEGEAARHNKQQYTYGKTSFYYSRRNACYIINVYKLTLKISGQSFALVISLALVQLGQRVAKRQGTESGQRNSGSQHNYSIFMNIK